MKGIKILCIVLSLAAIFSLLMIRDSVAWFDTITGTAPNSTIHVEKMAFSFNGTLGTYLLYSSGTNAGKKYVVTEQNLITSNGGKITVKNHSTVATETRFKITYVTRTPGTTTDVTKTYKALPTDALSVSIASGWTQTDADGYFYRSFATTDTAEVDAITEIKYLDELYEVTRHSEFVTDAQGQPVTNALGETETEISEEYNDILNANDYFPTGGSAFKGTVHVIFEAKQADSVDWQTITTWSNA